MSPDVEPLPYRQRKYLFSFLFLVFVVVLPLFVFYATGYRFDFSNETSNIVSTGGMYVSAGISDVQIYIDEEKVDNIRVFRSASYIQNLNEGNHELHVQHEGLQTWTKELPVYPHIVTEALSFNMPIVPQIRLITPLLDSSNASVVFVATTTEVTLPFASTTNLLYATTSKATSTYSQNAEYEFVASLFSTSTATSTNLVDLVVNEVEEAFNFDSTLVSTSSNTATTSKIWRDVVLHERGEDVYAKWTGDLDAIPYYYCIDHVSASSSVAQYGEHVYSSVERILASSTGGNIVIQNDRMLVCRNEIRLDRKWQEVLEFDFFPGSIDLVILHLTDGLYVVEVDDRAWQNTQLLYPGTDLMMILDGGRIYVKDGDYFLEVLTEIES